MNPKVIVRGGLLAAAASLAVFAALPASADTGGGEISGSGTISPGLTTTSTPQSFSFSGSGNIATASVHGSIDCNVSGSSTGGETVATGQGTFSGSCTGTAGSISVTAGTYLRAGGNVQISATRAGP